MDADDSDSEEHFQRSGIRSRDHIMGCRAMAITADYIVYTYGRGARWVAGVYDKTSPRLEQVREVPLPGRADVFPAGFGNSVILSPAVHGGVGALLDASTGVLEPMEPAKGMLLAVRGAHSLVRQGTHDVLYAGHRHVARLPQTDRQVLTENYVVLAGGSLHDVRVFDHGGKELEADASDAPTATDIYSLEAFAAGEGGNQLIATSFKTGVFILDVAPTGPDSVQVSVLVAVAAPQALKASGGPDGDFAVETATKLAYFVPHRFAPTSLRGLFVRTVYATVRSAVRQGLFEPLHREPAPLGASAASGRGDKRGRGMTSDESSDSDDLDDRLSKRLRTVQLWDAADDDLDGRLRTVELGNGDGDGSSDDADYEEHERKWVGKRQRV